jgi:hypothetical protein
MSSVAEYNNSSERSIQPAPKPKGCCDQISQALGRCWTWIVNGWHWFVDKVFRCVDAVAFGFFRVVGCFAPKLALKMEAGYGYLATWYARYRASVDKQISDTTIEGLEGVNRKVNEELSQKAGDLAELQVKHREVVSERDRLKAERNTDIEARAHMQGQNQHMERNALLINDRIAFLEKEKLRLEKELQEHILATVPIAKDRDAQSHEIQSLKNERAFLEMRTRFAEEARDLAYKSVEAIELLKSVSKIQGGVRCQRN